MTGTTSAILRPCPKWLLIALGHRANRPNLASGEPLQVASMIVEIKFSHRYQPDGTWQSICPECYKTVSESREERDLERAEGIHVCLSLNGRLVRID